MSNLDMACRHAQHSFKGETDNLPLRGSRLPDMAVMDLYAFAEQPGHLDKIRLRVSHLG